MANPLTKRPLAPPAPEALSPSPPRLPASRSCAAQDPGTADELRMGGPRTSSEAALSGPGRRASAAKRRPHAPRRIPSRDSRDNPPGKGWTLSFHECPALSSLGPAQRPWRPAAKPLGLLLCLSDRGWLVLSKLPRPNRGPSSLWSSWFTEQWPPAAWTTAAAIPCSPQRGLLGEGLSAALRFCTERGGMNPRQKRKKESLGLGNRHARGPWVTANPPLHKRRRHFGGELPGRCAVIGSLPPHHYSRSESSLKGTSVTCATRISATKANQTSEVPPADSATPSSGFDAEPVGRICASGHRACAPGSGPRNPEQSSRFTASSPRRCSAQHPEPSLAARALAPVVPHSPRPRSRRPRSLRPLSRRRRLSAGLQAGDGEGAGRCGGAGPLQVTMLPTRLLLQPAAKDSTPFPALLLPSLPLQPEQHRH